MKLDCALERGFKDTVHNVRTATEDRNQEFITHLGLDLLPAICRDRAPWPDTFATFRKPVNTISITVFSSLAHEASS